MSLLHLLLILPAWVMLTGCLAPKSRVIQVESLKELVAVGEPTPDGLEVVITGWYADGRLTTGEPQVQRHGDALRVEVLPSPGGTAQGQLKLRLKIPADVTTVEFGRKGAVIWVR